MKNKVLLVRFIILGVLVCLILVANRPYQFHQKFDQIIKIEILEKDTQEAKKETLLGFVRFILKNILKYESKTRN